MRTVAVYLVLVRRSVFHLSLSLSLSIVLPCRKSGPFLGLTGRSYLRKFQSSLGPCGPMGGPCRPGVGSGSGSLGGASNSKESKERPLALES